MAAPPDAELTDAFTTATRNAVTALFAEYPPEALREWLAEAAE